MCSSRENDMKAALRQQTARDRKRQRREDRGAERDGQKVRERSGV